MKITKRCLCIKKNTCITLLFFTLSFFYSIDAFSQIVNQVYTNYNGYWTSGVGNQNPGSVYPDNTHEMIGFCWNGTTYSTGVADSILTAKGVNFIPGKFKALSVKDIPFSAPAGGSAYLFGFGERVDGIPAGTNINNLPFTRPGKLSYILKSGIQGLNLGSVVTNVGSKDTLTFNVVEILDATKIGDGFPDIIIAQLAQPTDTENEIYFVDINGNLVGTKHTLKFNNTQAPELGRWSIDFFNPLNGVAWETNGKREIRLWARDAASFGLNAGNMGQVAALKYKSGGSADPGFVAYNTHFMSAIEASDDYVVTSETTGIIIPVLDNDTYHAVRTSLSISASPSHGTVQINADRTITYTPNTGFTGTDTFVYKICDNGICDSSLVTVDIKNYWIGTTGSSWGENSNWTAGVIPGVDEDIEFATERNNSGNAAVSDLHVDGDRSIGNLINLSDQKLVIPTATSLIVNGIINTNNQDRILIKAPEEATEPVPANGSLIFHQPTPVYGTVEMYSKAYMGTEEDGNDKYRWQYFGIPLHSVVANPTFSGSAVRVYQESKPGSEQGKQWTALSNASVLKPFQGYEITQPSAKKLYFSGQLVNRDLDTTLTATTDSYYGGQHVLANPYTASISINAIEFGAGMEGTVYMYNTGSFNQWSTASFKPFGSDSTDYSVPGQYLAVPKNQGGIGQLPNSISSMQGFVVKMEEGHASGTLKIRYSSTMKNASPQRIKQRSVEEKTYTIVDVQSENYTDRVWLFTEPECTPLFDNGWDGPKMIASNTTAQLFAMEEDGDYQINSTNNINNTYLGFKAGEKDRNYTFRFTHSNITGSYKSLYLLDLEARTVTDITADGSQYTFTATNTSAASQRFKILVRNPEAEEEKNDELIIYTEGATILVDNKTENTGELILYDISGRILNRKRFEANAITSVSSPLYSGVYVLKVAYETKEPTIEKIVIH